MKNNTFLITLSLVIGLSTINSCSKNDDNSNNQLENPKAKIFGEVPPADTVSYNSRGEGDKYLEYDMTFSAVDAGSEAPSSGGAFGGGTTSNPGEQTQAGILTAGEWNDLENWNFWEDILNNQEYTDDVNSWDIQLLKRYSFVVTDMFDEPVINAEVKLINNNSTIWKTTTDSKGKAELWTANSQAELTAEINHGNESYIEINVTDYANGINNIQINTTANFKEKVEIMFVVDATGSMSDEINFLKAELSDVISTVKNSNSNIELMMGSVFYRDETDEYVTRSLPFGTDKTELISFINNQEAGGGGDFPEAVHSALEVALEQTVWDNFAKSRLLFLLLDAPPHYNQEVVSSMEKQLTLACENGIKIIPITASGVDKATEFLMRNIAMVTNSSYIFITDDSGVGNDHLEPTIGEYEVEKLNDLMIKIINRNLE